MFTEAKAKEIMHSSDILMIPYSIQESVTASEDVLQIDPPPTLSDSFEVRDIYSIKDEASSNDEWAEVKLVEEVKLDEKETKHKSLFRRFDLFSF